MMGIAKNVVHFLGKTMKSWRVELTCGAETLKEVPINRHFSRGYTITIVVCKCPRTSDKHTEKS